MIFHNFIRTVLGTKVPVSKRFVPCDSLLLRHILLDVEIGVWGLPWGSQVCISEETVRSEVGKTRDDDYTP